MASRNGEFTLFPPPPELPPPAGVTSVNGDTGPSVVLDAADVGAQPAAAALTTLAGSSAFFLTLSDDIDAAAARSTLGLGTIATQNSNNVTITGGSVTGITDLAVADGGTGASTAAAARTNLGLVIGTDVQAFDSDLATIAGLTATTDNFIVSVSSAWASRTPAQVRTTLGLVIGTNVQAFDADLATIAGLTATTDNFIQAKSSAWASRTVAQVVADLGPVLMDGYGGFNSFTPTWTQGVTITKTINRAVYTLIGKRLEVWVNMTATSGGTANSAILVTIPLITMEGSITVPAGEGFLTDNTNGLRYKLIANARGSTDDISFMDVFDLTTNLFGTDSTSYNDVVSGDVLAFHASFEIV